ncbi:hypothetical protein HYS50_01755 [Candidatus Woesearchaeota archaeon]|nr:hypothetical protein [Candidatus Woesearchaeota archaeon]
MTEDTRNIFSGKDKPLRSDGSSRLAHLGHHSEEPNGTLESIEEEIRERTVLESIAKGKRPLSEREIQDRAFIMAVVGYADGMTREDRESMHGIGPNGRSKPLPESYGTVHVYQKF